MGPKYSKKDAAKDTRVSRKEVSKTWHQTRNDAEKSKGINRGSGNRRTSSKSGK